MDLIGVKELKEIVKYDPDTGVLTRKSGPRRSYKTTKGIRFVSSVLRDREVGTKNLSGYLVVRFLGKTFLSHRVAWALYYGEWPEGQIDHIDGNRSNNKVKNLRQVSNLENARNRRLTDKNTSGVVGVYWIKASSKWRANIKVKGKNLYLGMFTNKQDAIAARKAAEKLYGYHENHGR